MDSKKQQILHLEARTRRRRNDLRRAFNQELLQKAKRTALAAGGKRGRDETRNQASKRPKVDAFRLSRLPTDIQFRILGEMLGECQDVVSTVKAMPTFPAFTKEHWNTLKDTIDCRAFDDLKLVETITEDDGQYTRVELFYPQNQEGVDPNARDAANDFATSARSAACTPLTKVMVWKKNGTVHFASGGGETKTVMVPKRMQERFFVHFLQM